jgi:hypothetical protein
MIKLIPGNVDKLKSDGDGQNPSSRSRDISKTSSTNAAQNYLINMPRMCRSTSSNTMSILCLLVEFGQNPLHYGVIAMLEPKIINEHKTIRSKYLGVALIGSDYKIYLPDGRFTEFHYFNQ